MVNEVQNKITKKDWVSNFTLVGKPKIFENTFTIDSVSETSGWQYNRMNLGIDCGEKYGTVYAEMFGGFSTINKNVVYVHGKDEEGRDDFENRYDIAWENRFDEEVLEDIGDLCFITVGLEKTQKDKTFYKRFLTQYDAIDYISDKLTEDMTVIVKGNLKYSLYNDELRITKNIQSIVLSKQTEDKFKAMFTQTILLDKDSAGLKNIDKNTQTMMVDAVVLDYVKEYKGVNIKGQFPYNSTFEYVFPDINNEEQVKKIINKLFKVKKGYTQITFDGEFICNSSTVMPSWDDIPEEIKELVDCGIYTQEEALEKCVLGGKKSERMIIKNPTVRLVGEDKVPTLLITEKAYDDEDLILDIPDIVEEDDENEEETRNKSVKNINKKNKTTKTQDEEEVEENSDLAWLNEL